MNQAIHATGEAIGVLPVTGHSPITVIGTEKIRRMLDDTCIQQAITARQSPGVTDVVLNPDAHAGYGVPVGCVLVSPTHIYPGPVGVDIKCSMSLLQLDLPEEAVEDVRVRQALIDAILDRTPTGMGRGNRLAPKAREISFDLGRRIVTEGPAAGVVAALGIPHTWVSYCDDFGGRRPDPLLPHLVAQHLKMTSGLQHDVLAKMHPIDFVNKMNQLGSYGGGNHFGECEVVHVGDSDQARATAQAFGLKDKHVAFLSHCGSRGWGAWLANQQFKALQAQFETWGIPLPGGDKEMVYAPLGTPEAEAYLLYMQLGANFATVNHLLINTLVLEAFQEVIPGTTGRLVYCISHNIAREEIVNGRPAWVHRKGATQAFPARHHELKDTPFYETGHPILLPGNPRDGSAVMVAEPGAEKTHYSVNHGAGRQMGRRAANRAFDQNEVNAQMASSDILSNCRDYPKDESPQAYKDFNEVLRSVESAGLAREVARLRARFVIKDAGKADD